MSIIQVETLDELNEILKADPVVIKFTAPAWCVPCQRLAPHYEKVAEVLGAVTFVEVDIDTADAELVNAYEILSVPTLFGYFGGRKVLLNRAANTAPLLMREIQGRIEDANAYNR